MPRLRMRGRTWKTWLGVALGLGAVVAGPGGHPSADAQVGGMTATFTPYPAGIFDYPGGTLPVAWGDYDNDGFVDLPLFHNEGDGTFTEIPGFQELLRDGNYHGASWADYDKDGDLDLVLLAYPIVETRSLLLRNRGDGTFEDVAPLLGLDVDGYGETAIWGDFDADGWPDLFAPYYSHLSPFQSFFYRNLGGGTFQEIAEQRGVHLPNVPLGRRVEGAHWADYDEDGDLDLYCASHLFRNDGFEFTDVREQVGLPEGFDEGAEFVDYDNDGDLDLYRRSLSGAELFRNDGGTFVDATVAAGLEPAGAIWGDSWADVDHDGDLDLLYFVKDAPARLMLNQGDATFVSDPVFEQLGVIGDTSAWADYDNDGDLDVVLGAFRKQLLANQLNLHPDFAHTSLRVLAVDAEGLYTQHGATVWLRRRDVPSSGVQTRVVDGGSGYLTQSEYTVHFGVEPSGRYDLTVGFPSARGERVQIGPSVNAELANVDPVAVDGRTVIVYRDGTVRIDVVSPPGDPDRARRPPCDVVCLGGEGVGGCCPESLPVCARGGCCPAARPQDCGTHCCPDGTACGDLEGEPCPEVDDCPPHDVFPHGLECLSCRDELPPRSLERRMAQATRLFEKRKFRRASRRLSSAVRAVDRAERRFWLSDGCVRALDRVLADALQTVGLAAGARRPGN